MKVNERRRQATPATATRLLACRCLATIFNDIQHSVTIRRSVLQVTVTVRKGASTQGWAHLIVYTFYTRRLTYRWAPIQVPTEFDACYNTFCRESRDALDLWFLGHVLSFPFFLLSLRFRCICWFLPLPRLCFFSINLFLSASSVYPSLPLCSLNMSLPIFLFHSCFLILRLVDSCHRHSVFIKRSWTFEQHHQTEHGVGSHDYLRIRGWLLVGVFIRTQYLLWLA